MIRAVKNWDRKSGSVVGNAEKVWYRADCLGDSSESSFMLAADAERGTIKQRLLYRVFLGGEHEDKMRLVR